MKLLLALITLALSLATATAATSLKVIPMTATSSLSANPPFTITITTQSNVHINLHPNGVLDAPPTWAANSNSTTVPGQILVSSDGLTGTFVTSGTGVVTVSINATSQGNTLSDTVIITINPPPKPAATSLGTTLEAVLK